MHRITNEGRSQPPVTGNCNLAPGSGNATESAYPRIPDSQGTGNRHNTSLRERSVSSRGEVDRLPTVTRTVTAHGLRNYGNACFLNSAMQSIMDAFPVDRLERIMQLPNPGRNKEEQMHWAYFRETFVTFAKALCTPGVGADYLDECYGLFLTHFLNFSGIASSGPGSIAARLLNYSNDGKPLNRAAIGQNDPGELINHLYHLLGLAGLPSCTVGEKSYFSCFSGGRCIAQKECAEEMHFIVHLPVTGGGSPSLKTCLQQHIGEQILDQDSRVDYDHYEGGDRPENAIDKKVTTFVKNQGEFPDTLMLLLKIYSNRGGVEKKLSSEARMILNSLPADRQVELDIATEDLNRPYEAAPGEVGIRTVKQTYEVTSIICHSGSGTRSGHYITAKYCDDGRWYIYDDARVFVCPGDLKTYLNRRGMSGYIYHLKKVAGAARPCRLTGAQALAHEDSGARQQGRSGPVADNNEMSEQFRVSDEELTQMIAAGLFDHSK